MDTGPRSLNLHRCCTLWRHRHLLGAVRRIMPISKGGASPATTATGSLARPIAADAERPKGLRALGAGGPSRSRSAWVLGMPPALAIPAGPCWLLLAAVALPGPGASRDRLWLHGHIAGVFSRASTLLLHSQMPGACRWLGQDRRERCRGAE